MNGNNANQPKSKTKALVWSTIAGAFVFGFLGSGIFDGITGSGMPNAGGAIGAMIGAFVCGYLCQLGMAISAFEAILPAIQVLKFSNSFPWAKDPNVAYIGCPDHLNQVVYRLERAAEADNEDVCS